ncbi:MAG: hypothetical protein OH337_03865 [Candidatus Parvarchaeota archaeon]|nr:hypothetical protein [Candidatus Haiyanarchaeum thermophilum]
MSKGRNAFRSLDDVWHAVIGFIASTLRRYSYGWIISITITLIFIIYQALEAEEEIESYEDIVEFITGFIIGEIFTM